jgi:hypothetical protein
MVLAKLQNSRRHYLRQEKFLNVILKLLYREIDDDPATAPPPKISKFFVKKKEAENGHEGSDDENVNFVKKKSQFFSYRDLAQTNSIF